MKYVAYYASMNGDSGEREFATRAKAEGWRDRWRRSGGRIAFVWEAEGEPQSPGREIPITRHGKPVKRI